MEELEKKSISRSLYLGVHNIPVEKMLLGFMDKLEEVKDDLGNFYLTGDLFGSDVSFFSCKYTESIEHLIDKTSNN